MSELGDSPEARLLFDRHLEYCQALVSRLQAEFPGLATRDELVSFAQGGLWDAARRFDPEHGTPFAGFAYSRCRGAMIDGLRSNGRVPRQQYQRVKALVAVNDYCQGLLEDAYTAAPGAAPADVEAQLKERMAGAATAMALALEAPPLPAPPPSPECQVEQSQLLGLVAEGMATLTDAEAALVRRHYLGEESIEQIAKDLGLTKSWGSRLLSRAINKLTKRIRLH